MQLMTLNIKDIYADAEFNCREQLAPIDVVELANSIKTQGQLQPVIVRKAVPEDKISEPWVLLAGFRRRYACMVAGLTTIQAIESQAKDRKSAILINISENLNRKDLNIVEEGKTLLKLVKEGMKQKEIAEYVGKSISWVSTRIRLCELPDDIKKEAAEKTLSQYHINKLLMLPNGSDKQYEVFRKIKDQLKRGFNKTEVIVKKANQDLSKEKKRRTYLDAGRLKWYLLNNNLEGLHTRILAWIEGGIDNAAIFADIEQYAKSVGKKVVIPKDFDLVH